MYKYYYIKNDFQGFMTKSNSVSFSIDAFERSIPLLALNVGLIDSRRDGFDLAECRSVPVTTAWAVLVILFVFISHTFMSST